MEETSSSHVVFPKLTDTNYNMWSYSMKMCLFEKNLWGFIDNTAVPPAEDATAEIKEKYEHRRRRALATIAIAVSDDEKHHIRWIDNARDAWKALKTAFASKSRTRILSLKRQFVNIRLKDDE